MGFDHTEDWRLMDYRTTISLSRLVLQVSHLLGTQLTPQADMGSRGADCYCDKPYLGDQDTDVVYI